MGMLKTIDEVKNLEIEAGVVVNGIDNPNMMSVDSTEPVETKADELVKTKEEEEKEAEKVEKKVEKVVESEKKEEGEEKKEEEEKKDEKKEEKKDESASKSGQKVEPTDSKNVQKRIGALTKRLRTAERERDFAVGKNLESEAKVKELSSKVPDKEKPQKTDFEEEDEYIEALTDWKIDKKFKDSQVAVTKEIKDKGEKQGALDIYDGLDTVMESGREKYKDFNDVVLNEDLIISPELTKIVLDTDVAEDIMYYLASNPDESERISKLSTIKAAKEIWDIEGGLSEKPKAKEEEKKVKKVTKAPEPISTVKTDGVIEKDPLDMNPKEYRAWRESKSK